MGRIAHDAIIVTGWRDADVKAAHARAADSGLIVTDIADSKTNGYTSFLVAPDGSKEGWTTSNRMDDLRAEFINWLRHDDQYSLSWVAVSFGDEMGEDPRCRAWPSDGEVKRDEELLP